LALNRAERRHEDFLAPFSRKPLISPDSGKEIEIFGRRLKAFGSGLKPFGSFWRAF
jgi:hypothetical protein